MELYQAKFSKDVVGITIVALLIEGILLAVMVMQSIEAVKLGARLGLAIVCGVALLILAMNVLVLLWVPKDYRVTQDKLVVMGLFRPIKEIDRKEIKSVVLVENALKGATRTFASGGLYGFFGKFNSDRFGNFDMYARNSGAKAVLIESGAGNKLIIAPSEAEKFVEFLNYDALPRGN